MTKIPQELLVSYLYHDLINPIGAFKNGIELIEDSDDEKTIDLAMEFMNSSSTKAINILRFFRLAFGAMSSQNGFIDVDEVIDLLTSIAQANNVEITIDFESKLQETNCLKIIAIITNIAISANLRGGDVELFVTKSGNCTLKAKGSKLIIRKELIPVLVNQDESEEYAISPQNVYLYYLKELLEKSNKQIRVEYNKNNSQEESEQSTLIVEIL